MKYLAYRIELTEDDKKFIDNYDLGKYNDRLREHCNDKRCIRVFNINQILLSLFAILMMFAVITNDVISQYIILRIITISLCCATVVLILGMEFKNTIYLIRRNKFWVNHDNYYGLVWSTANAPSGIITIRFKSDDVWYEMNVDMINYQPFKRGELFQFCMDLDRNEIYPSFYKDVNCTTFDQRVCGFHSV